MFYRAEEKSADSRFSADTNIFSSCFYKKLTDFDPNRIRNWTKRVNIFNKDFVVIPVCTGSHWILLIVKMNHGAGISMMILDSANRSSQKSSLTLERRIKSYLNDEWVAQTKHQLKSQSTISFEEVSYTNVPQQPNGTDCGVYVMKFFTEFLNNLPLNQWPKWTPRFSHNAIMQLRTNTMFLIQELASKEGHSQQ